MCAECGRKRRDWKIQAGPEVQREIRRAISALQLAQEILSGLAGSDEDATRALLRERASALGSWLTRAELDAVSRFLEGESPEDIAGEHGLSARTVGNQIRSGCRRLGFSDRRELRGWWAAASGYILTRPPQTQPGSQSISDRHGSRTRY